MRSSAKPKSKGAGDGETLFVTVMSAKNITTDDKATKCDSFCRVSSTFNTQRFKTKVVKKTGNPTWDEEFSFFIAQPTGHIFCKVLTKDRWGREVSLGQVAVPVKQLENGQPVEFSYDLETENKKKGKASEKGEVRLKLHFPVPKKDVSQSSSAPQKKKRIVEVYTFGEELGRGGFSIVKKGVHKESGEAFAIKIIEKTAGEEELQLLQREIDIMKKLKHKNIISLEEVFDEPDCIYLVMELVTGGELFDQIVSRGTYGERDAANIVQQILCAVEYMHNNGIAHRDLKPENLLVSGPNNDIIKVTDFGLSKDFGQATLKTSCGTPDYVAPEVLKGMPYDNSVDIWSIGVITYILLCGFPPFYGNSDQQIFEKIMKADYDFPSPDWDDISDEAKEFIGAILVLDFSTRPSASDCLLAPWLDNKGVNQRQLRNLDSFRGGMTKINDQRKGNGR